MQCCVQSAARWAEMRNLQEKYHPCCSPSLASCAEAPPLHEKRMRAAFLWYRCCESRPRVDASDVHVAPPLPWAADV